MDKHDQSKSEPELVQISIDGNLNYAFKWWDKRTANEHEVRYVFKEPVDGGIFYMMIVCANRIPEGTGLAVVACYPDGTPDTYGYLPAVTEWDNGESDGSSRIMVMRPKDGFPEYRGLPRDLEEMIRDHREGKRQVRRFEKKDTTVDAIKLVEERVYSVQQQVNCLHGEVDKLGEGIGTVRLDIGAIAKNEYELRQENAELQRLQAEGYLKFAAKISGSDFTAFIYIMALGNRKKAADALGIPHRSFYDRVDKWSGMGSEYKRMFRLVEWRKNVGRQLKVRLEDSLLSGEPKGSAENPETIRDVMTRMKEQEVDSRDYPAILSDILDAMSKQNPANWRTVNKEVIGIITEELPQ